MKAIVDGLAIEYADEGSGPVLLMLHGWGQSGDCFDQLAKQLAGGFRVIRPDLPGFGGSEAPKVAWDVGSFVDFLQQFLSKLDVQPDILAGHSLGGQIAVRAVADGTVTPKKLILIAAAVIRDSHSSARNQGFRALAKLGKAATSLPGLRQLQPALRRRLYGAAGNSDYYAAADHMRPTFLKVIAEDLQTEASLIQVPTLLVWGGKDNETPVEQGRRLAYLIKGSRLEIYNDAGHFVFQDEPDRVASLVKEFADV